MTAPVSSASSGRPADTAAGGPGTVGLRFEGVSKVFPDGTRALDDVTFDVRKGEFVTIVGPSGCGKSTVLKIASGLIPETSGRVELSDPNIGYVFQDATLLQWRTVQRNVELFCELHKMGKEERVERAAAAVRLVGLDGFEGHYPNALSGGMRMRVSLARSLTLNPEIFLFDEPFGALDEITRERMNDEVLRLFRIERFAGLFITHSIYEAVYLSTRVLVMSARPGHIVAEFDVPFEYPRRPELRFEPAFAELSGQVSHALRGGYGP
ncbi:MAG: ATP-binding cassette domain-containing protein [Acidimicrobiia bacterium]|nr:ATP-binding cassette domain-containing protein [Acidimicrobiia bacterium]